MKEFGIKATWNFSEAYHGKGPADGVGGAIKRLLDSKVSFGCDVLNAKSAIEILKDESSVKLFHIEDKNIDYIKYTNEFELSNLVAVPNTMKIHQIQSSNDGNYYEINYRILSCFCSTAGIRGFCNCFSLKKHYLLKPNLRVNETPSTTEDELSTKVKPMKIRKRQIILSSDDYDTDEDIFTAPKKIHKLDYGTQNHFQKPHSNMISFDNNISNISELSSNKPSSSVCILSNVKVNYTKNQLKTIMLSNARYNMSSDDLKNDFKELFTDKENKSNSMDRNLAEQKAENLLLRKNSFFSDSSDEE